MPHDHGYSAAASLAITEDGRVVVTHYPIQGPDSIQILNLNQKKMAITKNEVVEELKAAHQIFTEATRRVFALMMKVQNMAETEIGSVVQDMESVLGVQTVAAAAAASSAASAAISATQGPAAAAGVVPAAKAPTAFVPQLNTQATIQAGLDNAKGVLRDVLIKGGMGHLTDLVDKVSPEDLHRVTSAQVAAQQLGTAKPAPTAVAPTPVVEAPARDLAKEAALGAYVGVGSIFAEWLNDATIFHGRGPLGVNVGLKRYLEDALWIEESTLREWPSGFYENRDTKARQLLVNTDQLAVVVDGLPSEMAQVSVLEYGSKAGFKPIQDFTTDELSLIHAKLSIVFQSLNGGLAKKNQ
jgi:hypothetical protein